MKKLEFKDKKTFDNVLNVWSDLADLNVLIDMMHKIIPLEEKSDNQIDQLKRIYNTLFLRSEKHIPEVEQHFAEMYINHLQNFLDKVQQCKNQKQ